MNKIIVNDLIFFLFYFYLRDVNKKKKNIK